MDKSADAKAFFGNLTEQGVQAEAFFDLLLSFFVGRIALAYKEYLRKGGMLLTNRLEEADSDFDLAATIRFEGGKYRFVDEAVVQRRNFWSQS